MSKVIGQAALAGTLLLTGFAAGWWSNSKYSPSQGLVGAVDVLSESEPAWEVGVSEDNNTIEEHVVRVKKLVPNSSIEEQFRGLLNDREFDAAMNIFDDVESQNESASLKLKQVLLEYLRNYLQNNQNEALMALIDAYLSRHYDDTDVLLILANFQWRQGYFDESAKVIQLALTYAHQPSQRSNVEQSFNQLVEKTDTFLSEQEQWIELLGFYEMLNSISLIRPEYQFRLAAIYRMTGDNASAIAILQTLLDDNTWSDKAQELLTNIEPETDIDEEITIAGIPLEQRGNHYLINVQLNDQFDVVLMIDTGASITSLSENAFSRISGARNFNPIGSRLFQTANGVTRGRMYRVDQLGLGEHGINDIDLAILDFQQGAGVDGLLGMNVLQHFRFEIDQDQQQLILQPR